MSCAAALGLGRPPHAQRIDAVELPLDLGPRSALHPSEHRQLLSFGPVGERVHRRRGRRVERAAPTDRDAGEHQIKREPGLRRRHQPLATDVATRSASHVAATPRRISSIARRDGEAHEPARLTAWIRRTGAPPANRRANHIVACGDERHVRNERDAEASGDEALHGDVIIRLERHGRLEPRGLASPQVHPRIRAEIAATQDPRLVTQLGDVDRTGLRGFRVGARQQHEHRVVAEVHHLELAVRS